MPSLVIRPLLHISNWLMCFFGNTNSIKGTQVSLLTKTMISSSRYRTFAGDRLAMISQNTQLVELLKGRCSPPFGRLGLRSVVNISGVNFLVNGECQSRGYGKTVASVGFVEESIPV